MFQLFPSSPLDQIKKAIGTLAGTVKKSIDQMSSQSRIDFSSAAIYLTAIGMVSWLLHRYFFFTAMGLVPNWNANIDPPAGIYNAILVNYAVVALSAVGGVALIWLSTISPLFRKLFSFLTEKTWFIVALSTTLLLCITSVSISKVFFAVSLLLFVPQFMVHYHSTLHDPAWRNIVRTTLPLILTIVLGAAFFCAGKSWYPITIPNDYLEIEDAALYPKSVSGNAEPVQSIAKRSEILDCLIRQTQNTNPGSDDASSEIWISSKNAGNFTDAISLKKIQDAVKQANKVSSRPCTLDAPLQDLQKLKTTLVETGKWQSEAGRALYHHSFVFVPAIHALTYGPLSPMPHLYGLGNSLFHAGLLALTEPTITAYFNTYPIAQATGLLCIVLLVLYITRSIVASIAAAAAALALLCSIGYEFIFLPPGFSPLRYAGLTVQAAAIVSLFRGTSIIRALAFLISIALSFVWNSEFGLIGFISQMLALMAPTLPFSNIKRFALILLSIAVAAASYLFNQHLAEGFLQGVGLGFFGLFPSPGLIEFIVLCAGIIVTLLLLVHSAGQFDGSEATARLCLIPICVLLVMKYLLYALAVHLLFALVFIIPLMLTYIRWNDAPATSSAHAERLRIMLAAALVVFCFGRTVAYTSSADAFRTIMITPYALHQWDGLGETFATPMPQEPITTRVAAIRAAIKPDDTLLILSPFDHLLSFYINPKRFCAHFEITVNPITYPMVQSIIDCAQATPQTLIVYDSAEAMPCPNGIYADYIDSRSCELKRKLKQNSVTILKALESTYTAVSTSGSLTFYRHK